MRVTLTDSSKTDIRIISENIMSFSDISDLFVEGIFDKMDLLIETPLIGASLQNKIHIDTDYRFLLFELTKKMQYVIIYRVQSFNETVYINRVFDAREDYLRILFGDDVD